MTRAILLLTCGALAVAACDNGGADQTVGLDATGVVRGEVYFDANGSRTRDAADLPMAGARVALLAPNGRDTLLRGLTGPDGTFRIGSVPVGTYLAVVDSASGGDSARVVDAAPTPLEVQPDDSTTFSGAISFPLVTTTEARALAPGARVFVRGIALHSRTTFGDTALHIADATGALRALRVHPSAGALAAGDSLILRGRVSTVLGQRVLDDVRAFPLGPTFVPPATLLTTAQAATGGGAGVRDAQLIRLVNALVSDTSTVAGNLQMTMSDGSGAVVIILDRAADAGFRTPFPTGLYQAGVRFDLVGVLVPTGGAAWRVKPRSALDLTRR